MLLYAPISKLPLPKFHERPEQANQSKTSLENVQEQNRQNGAAKITHNLRQTYQLERRMFL
jgi:hypothetical protein